MTDAGRMHRVSALILVLVLMWARWSCADTSVDCAEATVAASHSSAQYDVAHVIDGDESTFWAGDGHDLTDLPTNLIVRFPVARAVHRVEVVTQVLKERLRLKHLELYARTEDGGWAPLAVLPDNDQTAFSFSFPAVAARVYRFRIRDTHRPDHAWPRINEIRLFAPESDSDVSVPSAAPVPEESRTEDLFLKMALNELPKLEIAAYDPAKGYLWYVKSFLDTMLQVGLDRYGETQSPMFVSILSIPEHQHPGIELPPIAGQRQHDRANFGGNLQHDIPLLAAARYLSHITGEPQYKRAADQYLSFYLKNCTRSPTGLWPWGEHAHWDMFREEPGHDIHEFLGRVPLDLWEQAWQIDPDAVRREADGLLNHVVNLDTFDYNRHASLAHPLPPDRRRTDGFLDFPRHGGFYLQLWAFLYAKTQEGMYAEYCGKMMDKHLRARHPKTGLLPSTTTRPNASHGSQTQLSLAVTMLEAVPLLADRLEAERCRKLALEYLDALTALPHQIEQGEFVTGCPLAGYPKGQAPRLHKPGFAAHYGGGTYLGSMVSLWAQAYRLTEREPYLEIARGMARYYAEAELPLDDTVHTRAKVFGGLCNVMLDMYEITGEKMWLNAAERYARSGIEQLYCNGLFRGATGLWYYESELWVSTFCYSLIRLHGALNPDLPQAPALVFHR